MFGHNSILFLVEFNAFAIWGVYLSLLVILTGHEASNKGLTSLQIGIFFALIQLGALTMSAILWKFGHKVEPKRVKKIAIFLQAFVCSLNGLLEFVDNATVFFIAISVLNVFEGLASSALYTTTLTIFTTDFPKYVAAASAMAEIFHEIGNIFGEPFGYYFNSIGGYQLPFSLLGVSALLLATLEHFYISNFHDSSHDEKLLKDKAGEQETKPIESKELSLTVIKSPFLFLPLLDCFLALFGYGIIESMLTLHLEELDSPNVTSDTSISFFILSVAYLISSLSTGYLADKFNNPDLLGFIGKILTGICFLLLGPGCSLLKQSSIEVTYVAMAFEGLGLAGMILSSFASFHKRSTEAGFDTNEISNSIVLSGVWTASYSLGNLVGPLIGGLMEQYWGFSSIAFLNLSLILISVLITMTECFLNSLSTLTGKKKHSEMIN